MEREHSKNSFQSITAVLRQVENYIGGNYRELIIKVRSAKKWKWSCLSCFFSATSLVKSTLHSYITVAIYILQSFLQISQVTIMIYLRTSNLYSFIQLVKAWDFLKIAVFVISLRVGFLKEWIWGCPCICCTFLWSLLWLLNGLPYNSSILVFWLWSEL